MLITARRLGCGLEHLCGPGAPGENRQRARGRDGRRLEEEGEGRRDPGAAQRAGSPHFFHLLPPLLRCEPGRGDGGREMWACGRMKRESGTGGGGGEDGVGGTKRLCGSGYSWIRSHDGG